MDLNTMSQIMRQKDTDLAKAETPALDAEGRVLAEHKLFSIDQHEEYTVDPLR